MPDLLLLLCCLCAWDMQLWPVLYLEQVPVPCCCQCIPPRWHPWSRCSSALGTWSLSVEREEFGNSKHNSIPRHNQAVALPFMFAQVAWKWRCGPFKFAYLEMHMAQMQIMTHLSYQQRTQGNNTSILMHVSFFCNVYVINTAVDNFCCYCLDQIGEGQRWGATVFLAATVRDELMNNVCDFSFPCSCTLLWPGSKFKDLVSITRLPIYVSWTMTRHA